ncbi:hypothetical protein ACHAW5_000129 [Stephanodiscus triporus]|uniref:Uncharacterized protein n=1 Tax=Stephanodiscus triporus TaxID=2934178 RepID=A0ABD3MK60_9STRA
MTWTHHLVPISPFVELDASRERGDCSAKVEDDDDGGGGGGGGGGNETPPPQLPTSLKLPGRFGREELLRPFSKACPTCVGRRGRRRRNVDVVSSRMDDDDDGGGGRPILCAICRSIRSLAKFIPRREFWCFSYPEGGNDDEDDGRRRVKLVISGKDAFRLVRVRPSTGGGGVTPIDDACEKDPRSMELNDGDILSLLWHGGQNEGGDGKINFSSSALEPLVQFRLTSIEGGDIPDKQVGVSLFIDSGDAIDENGAQRIRGNGHEAESEHDERSLHHDADNPCGAEKHSMCDNKDHSSFASPRDVEHSFNIDGFVRTVTKEDSMARGNCFGDIFRDKENERKVGSCRSNSTTNSIDDDACLENAKGNSCDEGEMESAPLTLPSQFLASYSKSFSFDSAEKSPSISHTTSRVNTAECVGQSTPQKSNLTRKRAYHDNIELTEAETTPKRSNITSADKQAFVPMSSLSYDEMVELRNDATPPNSSEKTSPSLRRTILSLTLALTSNISLYDPNFMNDCNADANGMLPTQGRQWIPRLLRGAHIKKYL